MSDPEDDQRLAFERENQRTWTVVYKMPIAVGSALLALVFLGLLSGGTGAQWVGIVGLVLVTAWVIIFAALYRRGY